MLCTILSSTSDVQMLGEFEKAANDAAAREAGVGGTREDRALLAAAAEDDEGDGGAVTGLDSASAAGDAPEVLQNSNVTHV